MSLLGPHVPVAGWTPAESAMLPEADAPHLLALLQVSVILVRKRGAEHELGQMLANAYHYFTARLLEGRHEAAEVRYALGLPMTATVAEVMVAIRATLPVGVRDMPHLRETP